LYLKLSIFNILLIEFQLLNNAIGVIIVVNITKYIDKPSKPKYKSKELISRYSWTNWNWLLKSNYKNN
jgi:hypothetical protein